MSKAKYFLSCTLLLTLQACMVHSACTEIQEQNGTISDTYRVIGHTPYYKCWVILNPHQYLLNFELSELRLKEVTKDKGSLTIVLKDEDKDVVFWSGLSNGNLSTFSSKVEIHFNVLSSYISNEYVTKFVLDYQMRVSVCPMINKTSGSISDSHISRGYDIYHKCWRIMNLENNLLYFQLQEIHVSSKPLYVGNLTIILQDESKNITFWSGFSRGNVSTSTSYVEIHYQVDNRYIPSGVNTNFTLVMKTGIAAIEGISEARARNLIWLKSQIDSFWGWQEYTPRAITALFLANGANYNGTSLEEELMAKQTELKTALALLKNPLPTELLSIYINSLLVTCHSPTYFYGHNLVKLLKQKVESPDNFTHPISYLALCNANESWPLRAASDLKSIFNSNADYHFVKDIQAFAVMAVSCYAQRSIHSKNKDVIELLTQIKKTLKTFKGHQLSDGSFGNIETSALISQAFISVGQEYDIIETVKFLIEELRSPKVEFSSVYLSLPIFNSKSLADVFTVNCTGNPRKRVEGDLISDVNDHVGPKMRIQYSIFVLNDKDLVYTISVKVPANYTAYEVMQYAALEDIKYKFEWKMISGKVYVYKIGKVTNDPETGKFWLLYLGSTSSTDGYKHITSSPDKITLNNEDHLIMWFKTVTI